MATAEKKKKKVFVRPSKYHRAHTDWLPSYNHFDGYIIIHSPGGKEVTMPCPKGRDGDEVVYDFVTGRGWEPVDGGWKEVDE